ncbi:SHOCT domain-containing protein [Nocardioides sp. NPDC051685]|uniref:SHOCT domain-containing protein n=1 Tax=Nocardioides sp. NPDC051685 TaxID=3364334 RepID=UPI0037A70710
MMGYGYGMGAVGWIAMTIFWVGLITLVIWVIARVLPTGGGWRDVAPRPGGAPTESAEDILDRRFAAGELDEETYRSMRATLRSSRSTGTEPR